MACGVSNTIVDAYLYVSKIHVLSMLWELVFDFCLGI